MYRCLGFFFARATPGLQKGMRLSHLFNCSSYYSSATMCLRLPKMIKTIKPFKGIPKEKIKTPPKEKKASPKEKKKP